MPITLLTREGKGAPLTVADHDTNLSTIETAINELDAAPASTSAYLSVYLDTPQPLLANDDITVCLFDTTSIDTLSCYDPLTGRFTPNVAGTWHFVTVITLSGAFANNAVVAGIKFNDDIWNSAAFKIPSSTGTYSLTASATITFNGTTDYIEVFAINTSSTGDGDFKETGISTGSLCYLEGHAV